MTVAARAHTYGQQIDAQKVFSAAAGVGKTFYNAESITPPQAAGRTACRAVKKEAGCMCVSSWWNYFREDALRVKMHEIWSGRRFLGENNLHKNREYDRTKIAQKRERLSIPVIKCWKCRISTEKLRRWSTAKKDIERLGELLRESIWFFRYNYRLHYVEVYKSTCYNGRKRETKN